jgi:opacity protein-like surface antigen
MKKSIASFALASVLALGISSAALAQDATPATPSDPGHPRVNEVEQRVQNQENRVNQGIGSGKIDASQASKDEAKLAREQKSLAKDETKHNGHITKAEQKNLNKRLDKGSATIDKQENGATTTPQK